MTDYGLSAHVNPGARWSGAWLGRHRCRPCEVPPLRSETKNDPVGDGFGLALSDAGGLPLKKTA